MITKLTLENFKCFTKQEFPLRELTVLSGTNGGGKSSIVQSILLLKKFSQDSALQFLPLNGPFALELGSVGDVLNQRASSDEIRLRIETDKDEVLSVTATASSEKLSDPFLSMIPKEAKRETVFSKSASLDFVYLGAERLGPRDTYPRLSTPTASADFGVQGEFAVELLSIHERHKTRDGVAHPSSDRAIVPSVRHQLELWMREWVPDLQVRAKTLPGTNVAVLEFNCGGLESEWMRPANLGFGISHSFPVVLASLLVSQGGLLIVDSPESHLHPAGQSAIGKFLATVAASGVQVIVETHSDHVLNGIRLAVKKGPLQPESAVVLFVTKEAPGKHKVEVRSIDCNGKIPDWPDGFFDQAEKDLIELI